MRLINVAQNVSLLYTYDPTWSRKSNGKIQPNVTCELQKRMFYEIDDLRTFLLQIILWNLPSSISHPFEIFIYCVFSIPIIFKMHPILNNFNFNEIRPFRPFFHFMLISVVGTSTLKWVAM